jgi:peptidoglycan hydrolase-like protein with peptidoglycan-binding domain
LTLRLLTAVVAVAALLFAAGAALAETEERRAALVIGNAAYQHAHPLNNPTNDANAIAETLRHLGFDVVLLDDADRTTMVKALGEFRRKLSTEGIGLFSYAGHGMQVRGKNYLIPIDADIGDENDAALLAIDLESVQYVMEDAGVRLSLFILDACRDDPFERRFRSAGWRGLAPVDAGRGAVIAFATAPGKTAADGEGQHGLFTGELLKAMVRPGLELEDVLKQTAEGVERGSGNQQTPWYNSAFHGHFYFAGPVNVSIGAPPAASAVREERDILFWDSIKNSTDPADFDDFVKRYPQSEFTSLAQRRLAVLAPSQPPQGAADAERSWTPDQRIEIQRALRALGHFQGEADGGFGTGTRSAIKQFQSFEGAAETGVLSNAERATLLDMAQRLAALLDQAAASPAGMSAAALKGGPQRYARAWGFDSGKGGKHDPAEAAYWYALAASDGQAKAFTNFGTLVARGWGGSKPDPLAAALLWHAAAARGEAVAMFDLGVMYERGIGMAADLAKARSWYQRAATRNHPDARVALKRLG